MLTKVHVNLLCFRLPMVVMNVGCVSNSMYQPNKGNKKFQEYVCDGKC